MIRADLHIHTYYSDGSQSPADVVLAAKRAGLGLISVTDHDNSLARKEVKSLAEAAGIIAVNGEEISAYEGDVKVHILGYGMDCSSCAYIEFHRRLAEGADERTYEILNKLNVVGVNLSYDEVVRERKCDKAAVHAMYIAAAGARKGYASSPFAFYLKYLGYGTAGFSCICRPSPEETVRNIVACGGVASLAHPARIDLDGERVIALIERLKEVGLAGIEAVYSGHTVGETQYYKELADRYSLFVTGGSDTHSAEGNRKVGAPAFYPDGKLLAALKVN